MESLIQLSLIWASVFIASLLAKTRLTPVLWFLFVGACMVNLGILPHEPSEFVHGFAELGIIVIMFALGFEENSSQFMQSVKRSWGIAFLVPLLLLLRLIFVVCIFGVIKILHSCLV